MHMYNIAAAESAVTNDIKQICYLNNEFYSFLFNMKFKVNKALALSEINWRQDNALCISNSSSSGYSF